MSTADRGFASMDKARLRAICSLGGKAAHAKGTAHEWTSEEAKRYGAKGGRTVSARKKARRTEATGVGA